MEIIQPYINGIIQALVGLLATLVIAALVSFRQRVNTWLESKTTSTQRDILHKFSLEAFAFAETIYKEADGQKKYEAAYEYLTMRLKDYGIDIREAEIMATIEKAVLEYNMAKNKDDAK